jgi:hypothetical protein
MNGNAQIIRRPGTVTVEAFLRHQNIELLERTLKAEIDPDIRRVLRRLLREQERIAAAVKQRERN